jgi:type I site-specific restriction-modification system R (restriction) subunit
MEENEHLKKEIEELKEKLSKFKEDEVEEEEIEPKESKLTSKEIVDQLVTRGGEHNLGDAEIEIKCFTELISTISDNDLELVMPHSKKLFAHMNECLRKLVDQGLIKRNYLLRQLSSP